MKHLISKLFPLSLLFLVFLFLSGCKKDSTSTNPVVTKSNVVTCQVQEAIVLNFVATSTLLNNSKFSSAVQRTIIAQMSANSKVYSLMLSIMDKNNGNKSFKFDNGEENQVSFSISNDISNEYNYLADGEITFTELSDKSWVGSFHFTVKNSTDQSKEIKVITGKIDVKK